MMRESERNKKINKMEKEEIIQEIQDFANEKVEDLSDQDYMEVLYEVSSTLKISADAKAEELEN